MAELSIRIGADISDLLRKLKLTEKEFKKLALEGAKTGRTVEQVLKQMKERANPLPKALDATTKSMKGLKVEAQSASAEITDGLGKSSQSAINLRGGVEGVVRQLVGLKKAATASGTAMRSALIATGVGALLVALGLVIENWDKIIGSINKANAALLRQRHIIETTLGLRDAGLELLRAQKKLAEERGEDTSLLLGKEKKLLENQIKSNKELIETKKGLREIIRAEQKRISLLEDLGNVVGISPFSQKERDKINKYTEEILQAKTAVAGLETELFNLNNPSEVDTTVDLGNIKSTKKAGLARKNLLAKIESEIVEDTLDQQRELFNDVERIYAASGAKLKDALAVDNEQIEINIVFKGITENIAKVKELQRLIDRFGVDVDLESLNFDTSQLEDLEIKLKNAATAASILSRAISSSFQTMSAEISQSLQTGIGALDAFVSAIISGLGQMLAQLLSQLIAQSLASAAIGAASATAEGAIAITKASASGLVAKAAGVQIATTAAAALGPLGLGALPGFLALTQAQIAASLALAAIPSFAKGGFSGDDNLAFLNKQELVLRPQEQAALYNAIRGHSLSNLSNNPTQGLMTDGVIGEVILRGTTQVIQLRRAKKKMSRQFNS